MTRLAVERLDVLEPPHPKKGCNVVTAGRRCGRRVVYTGAGPFSIRRLCAEHSVLYSKHDRIVARIRDIVRG